MLAVGATFQPHRLQKLDGRSRQARYLRRIERELVAHLGGAERVSTPQRLLIERIAVDVLRLELLDSEMTAGTISVHDGRVAHALRNSLRLALRDLGLKAAAAKPPSLADITAKIAADKAAASAAA